MPKKTTNPASLVGTRILRGAVRLYQLVVSPWLLPRCRFHPCCSQYMLDALETHGGFRGVYFGLRRLLRCHPFNSGGFDPVPQPEVIEK